MLEVRENEIGLRKLSGGTAQLRTLEGTLFRNYVLHFAVQVTQYASTSYCWIITTYILNRQHRSFPTIRTSSAKKWQWNYSTLTSHHPITACATLAQAWKQSITTHKWKKTNLLRSKNAFKRTNSP